MVDKSATLATKAQLLAIVVMSDETEKPIEVNSVQALFEMYDSDNVNTLKQIYSTRVNSNDSSDVEELCKQLLSLSSSAKAEFLRDCWYVAACDKELVESEKELINKIAEHLGVSKDDSALALKSVG